ARPRPAATATAPSALESRWRRSSLRGASLDGEIEFDASGRLRWSAGLLRRFEHYLALLGEFSTAELGTLAHAHALREGDPGRAAQVRAAFEHYLGYRQAAGGLDGSLSASERLGALQALRRHWFGDDAQALFGEQADYDARA